MTEPVHADAELYRRQGFGGALEVVAPVGLLIVDLVNGFADPNQLGGGNIAAAIDRTRSVLAEARRRGWPVASSRIVFAADGGDANLFSAKVPSLLSLTEDDPASQIVSELAPAPGELVVRKRTPSAFFGTDLAPWLTARGIRSLAMCGAVTSGCVRASAVDAMCHGFRPFVLSDCVGDRAIGPHEANLFDMSQKVAEVLEWSEFLARAPAA